MQVLKALRRFDNQLDRLMVAASGEGPRWLTQEEYGYSTAEFFRSTQHIAERLMRWHQAEQK